MYKSFESRVQINPNNDGFIKLALLRVIETLKSLLLILYAFVLKVQKSGERLPFGHGLNFYVTLDWLSVEWFQIPHLGADAIYVTHFITHRAIESRYFTWHKIRVKDCYYVAHCTLGNLFMLHEIIGFVR